MALAADALLAFRNGDSDQMGRTGAALIADALQTLQHWSKNWTHVHSKK